MTSGQFRFAGCVRTMLSPRLFSAKNFAQLRDHGSPMDVLDVRANVRNKKKNMSDIRMYVPEQRVDEVTLNALDVVLVRQDLDERTVLHGRSLQHRHRVAWPPRAKTNRTVCDGLKWAQQQQQQQPVLHVERSWRGGTAVAKRAPAPLSCLLYGFLPPPPSPPPKPTATRKRKTRTPHLHESGTRRRSTPHPINITPRHVSRKRATEIQTSTPASKRGGSKDDKRCCCEPALKTQLPRNRQRRA